MRLRLIPLLMLLACGHSDPFTDHPPVPLTVPFGDSHPIRLTLNLAADENPSWSPDGSQIYWSAEKPLPGELDRCVSRMPATGGTLTALQCPPTFDATRSQLMMPTSDGTRLAWTLNRASILSPFAIHSFSIWVAGLEARAHADSVLGFPYRAPSGRSHDMPLDLQWLKPGVLLYLGAETGGCCAFDTLRFGEQVVTLDLSGATPVRNFVPGTERASAVARSEDGNSIYYTFPGDSLVYQQVLATGAVSILHNFGEGHVVRDPTVSGNTLVAVLDGRPKAQDLPPFGLVNVDFGGELYAVDLSTGVETHLESPLLWWRRPRFAPGGSRIVAEGFPYVITVIPADPGPPVVDTVSSLFNDIWIWEE